MHTLRAARPGWLPSVVAALAIVAAGCGEPEQNAQREPLDRRTDQQRTHDELKAAMAQVLDPSDGGGRAWLDLPQGEDGSGSAGRWTIVYEAGPLGVARGGGVYLQVSPFWGWSTPQTEYPGGSGYTLVSTRADGVVLATTTLDQQLMLIEIGGRALTEGERIRMEYGAGDLGARADSYAELSSRFWVAVDGDGDGARRVLADSPSVEVLPGPPARMVVTIPTTARIGQEVRVCVAVLDAVVNAGPSFTGKVELETAEQLELVESFELGPVDRARRTVAGRTTEAGVFRVGARVSFGGRTLEATSNPMLVSDTGPRVLWGDLHGHSAVSDGTGTPEDFFLFARDVAALDVVALTDHDHWGLLFMDEHAELWDENLAVSERFHEPGRFVTVHGYEWTNWIFGHRHVLFFGQQRPLLSSMDERYDTPQELWDALRGLEAITVPHHPAGGPVAIDWSVPPDPLIDPCTEITSAHGCSEALDCPRTIYSPQPGHFGRDALDLGYPIGFVGSGDGHDGHPGLTHLGPHYPTGGLTAILSEDLTRAAVLEALRSHRVYATSGPRILLRTALGPARMGTHIAAAELGDEPSLFVQVQGTAPILAVEVIRSGDVTAALAGDGAADFAAAATLDAFSPGEYLYVRVSQEDGGMAWSSPIFVD